MSHAGGFHTQLLSSNTLNKAGVTSNENLRFACQKQLSGFGPFSFIVLVKQHCQYLINGPFYGGRVDKNYARGQKQR